MRILMTDTGKRFNRDWIFRHFNYTFEAGQKYAITGHNGSGKSTLLQVIAGALTISEGSVSYEKENLKTASDNIFHHISVCAPYLELIEEMTAGEFLNFHFEFKSPYNCIPVNEILNRVQLGSSARKQIRYFSSGMKQRIKLAQAVFSDTEIVLLDEPCTNLDKKGIDLYHQLISEYCRERITIVSSNDEVEYSFCEKVIDIQEYK